MLDALRSFLFDPSTTPRKLGKAWDSAADTVIADLGDAIAEDGRAEELAWLARSLGVRPGGNSQAAVSPCDPSSSDI